MSSGNNLNRTFKSNIVIYITDGFGRDAYITYNDGGFWKNVDINKLKKKQEYERDNYKVFHSLARQPPPLHYHNDGTGRDCYISKDNGGLVKDFSPLATQKLSTFLRKDNHFIKRKLFFSKPHKKILSNIKKMQDNLIKRLYNNSIKNGKYKNFNETNFLKINDDSTKNIKMIYPRKNQIHRDFSFNKINIKNNDNHNKNICLSDEGKQKHLLNKKLKNFLLNNSNQNLSLFKKEDIASKIKKLSPLNINNNSKYYKINNFRIDNNNNNMKIYRKIDNYNNRKKIVFKVNDRNNNIKAKNNFQKNNLNNNNFNSINISNNKMSNNNNSYNSYNSLNSNNDTRLNYLAYKSRDNIFMERY